MLVASNGAPVGLDLIRKGWEQVEVEQPIYAQVYGARDVRRQGREQAGDQGREPTRCSGLPSDLTIEDWGPNLKIPGAAITKDNVDEPRFWGNLKPPTDPVKSVE